MSAVVISGNTSGSITLEAPAVSGSNTATLPVATGELSMLGGAGQTWQDVTASRASATTYTNSTGKPIFVVATTGNAQNAQMTVVVAGVTIFDRRVQFEPSRIGGEFIVPNGATYSATSASGFDKWVELR